MTKQELQKLIKESVNKELSEQSRKKKTPPKESLWDKMPEAWVRILIDYHDTKEEDVTFKPGKFLIVYNWGGSNATTGDKSDIIKACQQKIDKGIGQDLYVYDMKGQELSVKVTGVSLAVGTPNRY